MNNLYSSVNNYQGQNLGPYLNTRGFQTLTSCGINRTFKIRNETNCNIRILIKFGEFINLSEAQQKIYESFYNFDCECVVKPYIMSLINTSTFSFYVACFVELPESSVMLFDKLSNRSNDVRITDSYLLSRLKQVSLNGYISYLKHELQEMEIIKIKNY